MTGKIPLILFSGGVDSTYLLQETLRFQNVDILYVSGHQGDGKILEETKARKAIIAKIQEIQKADPDYFKGEIQHVYEMHMDTSLSRHQDPTSFVTFDGVNKDRYLIQMFQHHQFQQILGWLYGAINAVNPKRHSGVSIAYVEGDSINSKLQSIHYTWDHLSHVVLNTPVPISFPLQFTSKEHIFKATLKELFELAWYCEGQTDTPCKKCKPCITFAKTMFSLHYQESKTPEYPDGLKEYRSTLMDKEIDTNDKIQTFNETIESLIKQEDDVADIPSVKYDHLPS